MPYVKQTWTNDDPGTPLSGPRLNHMEDGIEAGDTAAGLDTLGYVQGIFIENEGTLPAELPIYALVIEQE